MHACFSTSEAELVQKIKNRSKRPNIFICLGDVKYTAQSQCSVQYLAAFLIGRNQFTRTHPSVRLRTRQRASRSKNFLINNYIPRSCGYPFAFTPTSPTELLVWKYNIFTMEPPPKRQRISHSASPEKHIQYDDTSDDQYDDALNSEDGESEDETDEAEGEALDPDFDLGEKRAQCDQKLKTRFEAIFEKYGKDFSGVGDEIDLYSGRIVVNNGHIAEMQHETDAGTTGKGFLRPFTQDPEDEEEEYDDDDDELEVEFLGSIDKAIAEEFSIHMKQENMEEDDRLLNEVETSASNGPEDTSIPARNLELDQLGVWGSPSKPTNLPSESEILAQFGPDLGVGIIKYISQQRDLGSSTVEDAWRTPGLPVATSGKRPLLKSVLLQSERGRSPSPETSASIWKPIFRRRKRRVGGDTGPTDILDGEITVRRRPGVDVSQYPEEVINRWKRAGSLDSDGCPRRIRNPFTEADDALIYEWATKAQELGLNTFSLDHWRKLVEIVRKNLAFCKGQLTNFIEPASQLYILEKSLRPKEALSFRVF
jgi:hypothetical protein